MALTVLVTGASSGIGYAIACDLVTHGHQVFAGVRKIKDGERLQSDAPSVHPILLDVTDSASIQQAFTEISRSAKQNQFCLVNNAGIAVAAPMEAVHLKQLRRQFDVNFFGLIEVTQAFLPLIRKTTGRIVNISSVSGLLVAPFLGPYSASKFAVEAASDALRRELAPAGIKVIVIEPGPIQTPIWAKGLNHQEEALANMHVDRLPYYEAALERFQKGVAQVASAAIPASSVAEQVRRALLERHPPVRQVVASRSSRLEARLGRWLPDRWVDQLVRRQIFGK